ncbi:MAG TPA: efflux RND transporter periplasmic adaptor subunit [Elusimicrobiales bacterium]|nr:efflux RND transporter periplasmic adaptor subunit [Elusimicrobiales bacterium]
MIVSAKAKKVLISVSFLSLFMSVVLLSSCSKKEKEEKITLINPQYGTIAQSITTTGVVEPQNRLEIKPTISGRIEEIRVKEGDNVKKGTVLALLSSTERASLLDTARLQDKETLKYWEDVYKPTPLISPINGRVIVRAKEPGQSVTQSDVVVVLSDKLVVVAQVDETDIGSVKKTQNAIITLDAYPDVEVPGKISHISFESEIVNNVTIYEVDITPQKVPSVFRSGMSASVKMIQKQENNALLIPLPALKQQEGAYFIEVQDADGKIEQRQVKVGIIDDNNAQILSGIGIDDTVLVREQNFDFSTNKDRGKNPFLPTRRRDKK